MKLTARQIDSAKPKEKSYKLADGAVCIWKFFPMEQKVGGLSIGLQVKKNV
ncbi:putative phage integrase [Erwinia tracheiphila PSU-1]|nr:putative phage integrase [Erwinia tracheiphila PSU-1]